MAATVGVIIPAFNEERSIGLVIDAIPAELVQTIVVCDNGSTDNTATIASHAGAVVVYEPKSGYGNACLAGIAFFKKTTPPDIIVFLDGDFSDYPEEMPLLIRPILDKRAEMVIGSRVLGKKEAGALLPHQAFGNWLAVSLIRLLYGYRFTDLGPFRAITWHSLMRMNMADRNYGWTVEMQVKAARLSLPCTEVPVCYRKRIGISKVSGTIKGSVLAGYKIIGTILKESITSYHQKTP
jgi:glycosyltransferase involved in cell wall biosynthesis